MRTLWSSSDSRRKEILSRLRGRIGKWDGYLSKMCCPIEKVVETETAPQQVEVTGVKITKKSKKIIAIATIAVIAVAMITAIGVQTHKKNVAEKAAAEAQKQSRGIWDKSEYGSIFHAFWCK